MINIKISIPIKNEALIDQAPQSKGIWKNCKFHINSNIQEADFWVVYEGLSKKEKIKCNRNNTILITGEPPSVKQYQKSFINQFGHIITCHTNLEHENVINTQQALSWRVGIQYNDKNRKNNTKHFKSYDILKKIKNVPKNKNVSVIISNKQITKGHKQRYKFANKLKEYFKDQIDIYGAGMKPIPDKWDAIAPYKYHIAIENSVYDDYWTEKLSDSFLGLSYPIYHGCPNIYKYFSQKSLSRIDINQKNIIEDIEKIIDSNTYEKNINELVKAKQLILDKYNLFPLLHDICNKININNPDQNKEKIILKPENKTNSDVIKKYIRKIYEFGNKI